MGMHEDRIKSLRFEKPEFIPVSVGILPAGWMHYREALEEVAARHPLLFGDRSQAAKDYDQVGGRYVAGQFVDAWGCVYSNVRHGMDGIITGHPAPTREDVHALTMPEEDIGFPHGFMFLRLTDLRGFAEMMIDFAEEPPELQMLIDLVLEYNLRQARIQLKQLEGRSGEIVGFGDDLGMQHGLPMSPETWRKHLKPCFEKIYRPYRDAGHYIYMHTDGHILEIIPDLVDCGVNVVNPQFRANNIDELARIAKGKICIDLDLDRQMFPFCSPADIDAHIEECVRKLGAPEGGLWLKAELNADVPLENIEAVCSALEKYRTWFA